MMMLNTGGDEGTEKTILNCFRKSWISVEAQTGAMNDHDDPFKEIMNYGEDGSAVEELEFYLNQLHKTRPDLAPKKLNAYGLDDFDRDVVTNESRPLSVNEIVKEYLPQPAETVENISSNEDEVPDEPISPPSRNEVGVHGGAAGGGSIEMLSRLTLFSTDSELNCLLQQAFYKTNEKRLDKIKQGSITEFFPKE